VRALDLVAEWPVTTVAAAVVLPDGTVAVHGPAQHPFRLASIAKLLTARAALVAVEEGIVGLDEPLPDTLAQPGCTLRHLLAHAGGYGFDGPEPIARPATRRIYSNTGIELAARAVAEAAEMPFVVYLTEAVLAPLGMANTELRGSPAHGVWSTLDDMVRLVAELRAPSLVTAATASDAASEQFPRLTGVVPGLGRFAPCPWGLGAEIRGHKQPHWTGTRNSPATFGHFGGAGTLLWVDPVADVACIALTDRPFDDWAAEALRLWPQLADAVLAEIAAGTPGEALG
jgi:CubicO group peptidase (beta-lactamase class C family)